MMRGSRGPRRGCRRHGSRAVQHVVSSLEALDIIRRGRQKYASGDRMGALDLFEEATTKEPTTQQLQEARYCATCVHASFGDVELAKMMLRDAVDAGLDFEAALVDPEMVKMETSTQVLVQLRKFCAALSDAKSEGKSFADKAKPAPPSTVTMTMKPSPGEDIGDLLSTDIKGIDASFSGAVKRIAILLAVCIGGYILLFNLGLRYAFPE
eukprot:evm.model.scf_2298.1 EVM.evm.TU.scf_2298.1   scf_2298:2794-9079(+)